MQARYIMIGGFLGAGKTTSVLRLAERLTAGGARAGLITNDQGEQLVDTALLASRGFATEEIAGGCFCCRFNSLLDAARKLSAQTRPDVFIAEPVGSCTDLVATVTYPLRRIYGNDFSIAPLSVLVDPIRARRIFGLESGGKFSEKVLYIYRKQLQEADLIVINKCDAIAERPLAELQDRLASEFPQAELFNVSARTGAGLDKWFERIATSEQPARVAMDVDYEIYAEGEALLGWLNATVELSSELEWDGNETLRLLAGELQKRLASAGAEVAHLKMTLSPDEDFGDIAVINLVRNDYVPELSQELAEPVSNGQLIINLRAEIAPDVLKKALEDSLQALNAKQPELKTEMRHLEHFRPGKPVPTHRLPNPV